MFSVSALSTHFQLSTHLPVTQSNIGVVSRFSGSLKISPCEERILNVKIEDLKNLLFLKTEDWQLSQKIEDWKS